MNARQILWVAALALPAFFRGRGANPVPGGSSGFNLEERKQKQPWVWETPARQKVPAVQDAGWPRDPVDRFILHRLEGAGLKPAPEADDRTWLRRVHFAITGLPPTREEVEAFQADRGAGARERVVDRLLASPHFGERWARHWLDLMRYAESRGHEGDYIIANAWHYRDYVIRAFNLDVPYDRFLTEHLAGDLVPKPRLRPGTEINESVLATGWAFLGEENHSPVDIRQDECERIDNKVDVFSKTFLGLTVSCARCHDHKFDPIRSQDYYALTGFVLSSSFRQVRFEAMENNRRMAVELASLRRREAPELARRVAEERRRGAGQIAAYMLAAREAVGAGPGAAEGTDAIARARSLDRARLERWIGHLRESRTNAASPLHRFAAASFHPDAASTEGFRAFLAGYSARSQPALPEEARVVADFTQPGVVPWKTDGEAFGTGPQLPGALILGEDPAQPVARVMTYGAARRDPFWNRLKAAPGNENDSGRLAATARSGQMLRTPTLTLRSGRLHYLMRGRALVYAAVDSHLMVEGPLHGRLVQAFDTGETGEPRWVTHDLSDYVGHRVHVEFGPDRNRELEVLMVVDAPQAPAGPGLAFPFEPADRADSPEGYARAFERGVLKAIDALSHVRAEEGRVAPGLAVLADWVVRQPGLFGGAPDERVLRAGRRWTEAREAIAARVTWESHTAISWFDGTGVDENVLVRGKPFKPGQISPRGLPAAFASAHAITPSGSSGRLELARQLVDPSNPLVARTFVNRVWHHLFGRGIVASVDNFGMLGERPTHPELLDHLAWKFVHEDRWSTKRLVKRLVLTRTFAMSSRLGDAHTEEVDPANALLHRMPVRRLEGEVIRDALLTVSGRLNPKVGGPPIPVHLTEFLVGRGRPEQSGPLDGDGRRSIYTGMRRNFLPTFMQTFDAPTPFSTVGRRNVTNVPAQALALMNDPLFHQQARVWAERLLRETAGSGDARRIEWLFESGYGRRPTPSEAGDCEQSLAELRRLEGSESDQGLAAWVDLCHALLNSADFIYVK
jgi:hypothetical protein